MMWVPIDAGGGIRALSMLTPDLFANHLQESLVVHLFVGDTLVIVENSTQHIDVQRYEVIMNYEQ